MIKECVICGTRFEAKRPHGKYCSKKCANHSRFDKSHEEIRKENKELKKELLRLYKSGLKDREIAGRIGKSVTWTRNKRVELGLPKQVSKNQMEKARVLAEAQLELRFCKKCGNVFSVRSSSNKVFCSRPCEQNYRHSIEDIKKKRVRKYISAETDDISLWDVYKRDNGICYLCGEKCDPNDYKWINGHKNVYGNYPSRDHVKPISRGGLHSWDNVRLAHIKCNSAKGARCD